MFDQPQYSSSGGKIELPPELVQIFIAASYIIKASKRKTLIYQTDLEHDVYYLVSGKVEVSLISPNAKEYVFREMHPGEIFGELSALDNKPRSVTVTAIEDVIAYKMPRRKFLEIASQEKYFGLWLMCMMAQRIRDLSDQAFELSSLDVPSRIVLELIRKCIKSGIENDRAEISLSASQDRFAKALGTHREAINRELKKLSDTQLISRKEKKILIHSFTNLEILYEQMIGV